MKFLLGLAIAPLGVSLLIVKLGAGIIPLLAMGVISFVVYQRLFKYRVAVEEVMSLKLRHLQYITFGVLATRILELTVGPTVMAIIETISMVLFIGIVIVAVGLGLIVVLKRDRS